MIYTMSNEKGVESMSEETFQNRIKELRESTGLT